MGTPVSRSSYIGIRKSVAVNSSVDLGAQKRKPLASNRKRVNIKESTLEPEIGVELKIQLA